MHTSLEVAREELQTDYLNASQKFTDFASIERELDAGYGKIEATCLKEQYKKNSTPETSNETPLHRSRCA